MRRTSAEHLLTKHALSFLKYSSAALLAAMLLQILNVPATCAQSPAAVDHFSDPQLAAADPFAEPPPSAVDPFAEPPPVIATNPFAEDAETSQPPASSKPTEVPTEGTPLDQSPASTPPAADESEKVAPQTTIDPTQPAASQPKPPVPAKPLNTPAKVKTSQDGGWVNWLLSNWYWGVAVLLLPILGWLFSKRVKRGKRGKRGRRGRRGKASFEPEIKSGSFKKSDRFKEDKQVRKPEGIASQLVAAKESSVEIETGITSDAAVDSFESEFSNIGTSSAAAAALSDSVESVDEADDIDFGFDTDEQPSLTSTDATDDDDFLDLVLDQPDQALDTNLEDNLEDLSAPLLLDDHEAIAPNETQAVSSEIAEDDDDFFDMVLDDDESEAAEAISGDGEQVIAEVADDASHDLQVKPEAPVEPISLDDDSDEFSFDFDDEKREQTAPDSIADAGFGDSDEPPPPGGLSLNEDEVLIDIANGADSDRVEVDSDEPSIVGGATVAAAGVAAGLGALLTGNASSDPDQPSSDAASDELRGQLAQALEKSQQSAREIEEQKLEISELKKTLANESGSSEQLDKLKAELKTLQDERQTANESSGKLEQRAALLEEKLEAAETSASDFESRLLKAESDLDAAEKEKQEVATALEQKSAVAKELAQLETDLSAAKTLADEKAAVNEELQSEIKELRNKLAGLEASEPSIQSGSLLSAAIAGDAQEASASATEDAAPIAGELQQLKALLEDETALRKRTETMLVQAEEQRTVVALALRDLRKQTKAQSQTDESDSARSSEEIDALKLQLEESKSANEELENRLADFRKKLALEHDMAKELTGKLNQSLEKFSAATIAENESAQKLKSLESEVDDKKKEISRLTTDLQDAKDSLQRTQAELGAAKNTNAELEASVTELQEKSGKFSYGQLEAALANVAKVGEERIALELKLEQTRSAGEEAGRENAKLSERVSQLEKQLSLSSEVTEQLKEARKELDAEKARAAEVDKKSSSLQLQVDSLKQSVESLDRQRLSLKENLEAHEKEATDREAVKKADVAKLNAKIAELENQLSQAQSDFGTAEEFKQQLDAQKDQLTSSKKSNAVLTERIAGLETQLKGTQADKEKLGQTIEELGHLKTRLVELNSEKTASQQRLNSLEEEIANVKETSLQLFEANEKLAKAEGERAALEQKTESLLEQINQAKGIHEKNERLNQQLGFLQRDLENAEKTSRALRMNLDSGKPSGQSGDNEKLEMILTQLQSQNSQIASLVKENEKMAAKLASTKKSSSKKSSRSQTDKEVPEGCDDLSAIVGIGPQSRQKLYEAGVKTYRQIAAWDADDIAKYNEKLGYKSKRIQSEKWVAQAKKLV